MNIRIKPILIAIGLVVSVGIMFRYCAPTGNHTVVVPLDGHDGSEAAALPPSHVQAKRANPLATFTDAFKTPIELYGIVEDQNGDPVPGATVTLTPVDVSSADESHSKTILTSDAKGKFSIKGLHGFSMGTHAAKKGYLDIPPLGGPASSVLVSYANGAEQGKRYSNPETPLILRLQKVGVMEPMVYVKERRCRLPVDGTVQAIALDSEKGVGNHQIEFRFKTESVRLPERASTSDRFDWSFEACIPGGGFIWSNDDYDFEAPETGYKEYIRVEYKVDMPKELWQRVVYGSFFVKFADGSHGRIHLSIDGLSDRSPLMLGSWLNLKSGSRNLATEQMVVAGFDREKYIKAWGW